MSTLFCDGFDSYAATADLIKKWASSGGSSITWNATAGHSGGGALVMGTTGSQQLNTGQVFSVASAAFGCAGFWFKASAAPAATAPFIAWQNSSNVPVARYAINTSGFLCKMDQGDTTIQSTGSLNICDGAFHWIETKDSMTNSSGSWTAYVDTVSQFSASGNFVNAGSANNLSLVSVSGITITIDDLMLYDATGTTGLLVSSFPYGPRQIITVRPTGDSSVQFTPSTGATNFSLVDETAGDTSNYVQSGTSGNQDLYAYGDLSGSPTVNTVVVNSYLHNPNPGSINYEAVAKSSATTSNGTSKTAPSSPLTKQDEFGVDPNTSAAWTATNFNAATFGIKVA